MFHACNEGSKSIDTLNKPRFVEFLDRSAQLFAPLAAAGQTVDGNTSLELFLAALDNGSGKQTLAAARNGVILKGFKCTSAEAQNFTKTVQKVLAASNKKVRDARASSVRTPVTNRTAGAKKPVPKKPVGVPKLAIPKKVGTRGAGEAQTSRTRTARSGGGSVFDRLSTPRETSTKPVSPREPPKKGSPKKGSPKDFCF